VTGEERAALLREIAATAADYRAGEIAPFTVDHVEQWLNQFPAEAQPAVLKGTAELVRDYYISRDWMRKNLVSLVTNAKLFGEDTRAGILRTKFLNCQRHGSSQRDLLTLLDDVLQEIHGLRLEECGANPTTFIYLDDCLYSGNTVLYDLKEWLTRAEPGTTLHIVTIAVHSRGFDYVSDRLLPIAKERGVTVKFWQCHTFLNKPWEHQKYDCLWPREVSDGGVLDAYCANILEQRKSKGVAADPFRPIGIPATPTIFSSIELREAYEKALLAAGVQIVSLPEDPKAQMRPLGYDTLLTLGFGGLLITYRNISNNCPLALWWGDPDAPDGHPLGQWYPLFPRKTND
jgi:hypothetical protein